MTRRGLEPRLKPRNSAKRRERLGRIVDDRRARAGGVMESRITTDASRWPGRSVGRSILSNLFPDTLRYCYCLFPLLGARHQRVYRSGG